MGKRHAPDSGASSSKRQRVNQHEDEDVPVITSSHQLRQILTFQQDAVSELRIGIKSLNALLITIRSKEDKPYSAAARNILKEYLQSQITEDGCIPDLLQLWDFAGQTNNDGLISSVPSVLATLLRTISSLIEFRELGSSICRGILQQTHIKLLAKSLGSPKNREFIVSPATRLITELVTYDGGSFAKRIYAARDQLLDYKIIARNLSCYRPERETVEQSNLRPSARLNTIRLLLALLKHLPSPLKAELLKNHSITRAVFEHCKHDNVAILKELFVGLKTAVYLDAGIPRHVKSQAFNEQCMCNLAASCRDVGDDYERQRESVIYDHLRFLCTDSSAGVLRPSGWYPPGFNSLHENSNTITRSNIKKDQHASSESSTGIVAVRNASISKFAQFLRPYSSMLEYELLLDIFRAAPEIVADYFTRKSSFAFDPKLTSTWIGYATFIFSAIRLPAPPHLGRRGRGFAASPPPAIVAQENILPAALTKKVLVRCLNQQHDLVKVLTVQILSTSLQKLKDISAQYKQAAAEVGLLWSAAGEDLFRAISNRLPDIRDLVTTLNKTPKSSCLQYGAMLQLLRLYLEVFPRLGFEEKLDISQHLAYLLHQIESKNFDPEHATDGLSDDVSRATLYVQLGHALEISKWLPGTKWFVRVPSIGLSPFTSLLSLLSKGEVIEGARNVLNLLKSLAQSHGVFQGKTEYSPVEMLVATMTTTKTFEPTRDLFEFLDDIFARVVRKPIKYLDDLDELDAKKKRGSQDPLSLMWMAVLEQYPYAAGRPNFRNITEFLSNFAAGCGFLGEDCILVYRLRELMERESVEFARLVNPSILDYARPKDALLSYLATLDRPTDPSGPPVALDKDQSVKWQPDASLLDLPDPISPDDGLHLAQTKPMSEAVADGDLGALILCLSSEYPEVARQAYINLSRMMQTISPSMADKAFAASREIYLLLGILTNTVNSQISLDATSQDEFKRVPYILTAYAAAAAHVLTQPLHPLYSSIARFHTASPVWIIDRLPSHWLRKILSESSEVDDGNASLTTAPASAWSDPFSQPPFLAEADLLDRALTVRHDRTHRSEHSARNPRIQFVLAYILASLRTEADLAILHSRSVFEPLLALASDAYVPRALRCDVMRIMWRAACVEGGSTMLVTRYGFLPWLDTLLASAELVQLAGEEDAVQDLMSEGALRAVKTRIWDTCDAEHVKKWDKSGELLQEVD